MEEIFKTNKTKFVEDNDQERNRDRDLKRKATSPYHV